MAVRSRLASAGVVVVLLATSGYGVWVSEKASSSTGIAIAASDFADEYARAARAITSEELLEHNYILQPSRRVRAKFFATAKELVRDLAAVRADGTASDRALVDQATDHNALYLDAVRRLFKAADRHDRSAVVAIDRNQTEPAFSVMERSVLEAAARRHAVAVGHTHDLQRFEAVTSRLTPMVFTLGLLLAGLLGLTSRGSRRVLSNERVRAIHDSLHDALTGLPNRTLLDQRLDLAVRPGKGSAHECGLLLIDLDRFKDVNDTFGHHHGDALLTQVGARLNSIVRDGGTVARLGGDEFAVLLPAITDLDALLRMASDVQAAFGAPYHLDGIELDVEASMGAVMSGIHGNDATTLLQHADIAMYVAKTSRTGIVVYDPEIDGHSPQKLALLGELRRALARDELILHYQPKVFVRTGVVAGVEALVRWQHPTRGLMFPDSFIPAAEHSTLIGDLTHRILDLALAQARIWADAGRPLRVSVNLSARNLLDESLPEQVASLLAEHGVPATLLDLEVTESAVMTDPFRSGELLRRLAELGTRISIDDFGAGYTSLGQLTQLPIDELKIDRAFVLDMSESDAAAIIVRSIIDLGHNLGLTIVAEGVENRDVLRELATFGCDVAQGYHIARPAAIDTVDRWMRHQPIGHHDLILGLG